MNLMENERLTMAVKNFQNMDHMVQRYIALSRAYVKLAERFHQLDVEHMALKQQMVPLLKTTQAQQRDIAALHAAHQQVQQQQRQDLQQVTSVYEERLQTLTQRLAELEPLSGLLQEEAYHSLEEAEEQMALVEATLQEMDDDCSPDLSADEKALLADYQRNPEPFQAAVPPGQPEVEPWSPAASAPVA